MDTKPLICGICGRKIENESDSEAWLTGKVHILCKKKEEKAMKDKSSTVYGKEESDK